MRDNEFTARLRSGADELAAAVNPPPPDAVRRRGDHRRRRVAAMSGVLALAVGVGGGGAAYASLGQAGPGGSAVHSGSAPLGALASASAAALPGIVAVTTGGAVEVLNPVTGMATRVLVPQVDAIGDEVSVSGATVYFAVKRGCVDSIESVPLAGGAPTVITTGVLPAVSPDGTKLAFVREPVSGGPSTVRYGCSGTGGSSGTGGVRVVVRELASGTEKTYPAPAGEGAPSPVSHLSWSPSGSAILVSAGPAGPDTGWFLSVLNAATSVPVTGRPSPATSYYREGVYLPDGNLFVDRACCTGLPSRVTSTLLQEVSASGRLVRQVSIGFNDRDHTSLDASSGGLLLYLSGHDLYLYEGRGSAYKLTSGLIAATWLPS